jgi:LysM repeat protein
MDIDSDDKTIICEPYVSLMTIDCALSNGGISVRAELSVVGTVFEERVIDTVTDITESDVPNTRKRYAVTVYFPEKEESLWSIARRYNTTVNAIADENGLDGDTTADLKILFIPAV